MSTSLRLEAGVDKPRNQHPVAFSAVTLAGHREEHPACKCCNAGMIICLQRRANDLYIVQLMPLPPRYLCFIEIQNGLPFWCWAYPGCSGKEAIKRVFL